MVLEFLRRLISSVIVWCIFLAVYLLVLGMLGFGVLVTGKAWLLKYHENATGWPMVYYTARVLFLAAGFLFVFVQPFLQLKHLSKVSDDWKHERRSGHKN